VVDTCEGTTVDVEVVVEVARTVDVGVATVRVTVDPTRVMPSVHRT